MAFHSTQNRYISHISLGSNILVRAVPFVSVTIASVTFPFLHFSQGLFSISQPIISSGLQAFVLTVPSALIAFPALALLLSYHSHPPLENEIFNLKAKHHLYFFHCTLCFFSQYLSQVVIVCLCVLCLLALQIMRSCYSPL